MGAKQNKMCGQIILKFGVFKVLLAQQFAGMSAGRGEFNQDQLVLFLRLCKCLVQ